MPEENTENQNEDIQNEDVQNEEPKEEVVKEPKEVEDEEGRKSLGKNLDKNTFDPDATEKPEGLDEKFWDKDNDTYNLAAIYKNMTDEKSRADGLRKKMSEKGKEAKGDVPKEAKDYELEVPKEIASDNTEADDELLSIIKNKAFDLKIDNATFNEVGKIFMESAKEFMGANTVSQEDFDKQEAERVSGEIEKLGESGKALVTEAVAFTEQLKTRGIIQEGAETEHFEAAFLTTAEGIKVVNRIRNAMAGVGAVKVNTDAIVPVEQDGLPTDQEILDYMRSDKYMREDPAAVKQVNNWMKIRGKSGRPPQLQAS